MEKFILRKNIMEIKKYDSPYPIEEKETTIVRYPLNKQQAKRKAKDRRHAQLKKRQQRQLRRMRM